MIQALGRTALVLLLSAGAVSTAGAPAPQSRLVGQALVQVLRQGGHVLVMRHANSPGALPDTASAHPGNVTLERQLSEAGQGGATAMGRALRDLKIPIGRVLSSPTFRARETARLLAAGTPELVDLLGDGGQAMQPSIELQVAWLRRFAAAAPAAGTNTLVVTHSPNIAGAFLQSEPGAAEGETVVMRADGQGGSATVARIRIEEWATLGR